MSKPDRGDNSNDLSSIWRGRGGWSRKYLRTNLEAVRIPQVDRGNASDVPPGFGNLDVPPGFENPDVPPGFENPDVPPGFENLDVPPGFGNRDVPPSFGNPDVPPGFGKNQRLRDDGDGVLNPDVPPGSESLDVPPGFGKRNLRRCDDDVLNPDVPPGFRKQNQRRCGNGDGVLNPDVPSGFGKQNQHCRENGDGVLVPATMMGRVLEGVIEAKFDGGLVLGTECGELKGVAGGILRGAAFRRRAQTSASIGVAADVPMRRRETLTRLPSAYSYRNQNLCSKVEAWTGCNAKAANLTVSPFAPETPPGFFVPVELKPVSLPDSVTAPTRGGNDRSTVNNQVMVRRVIPSDNSCLFNAVGYVMDHDKHKAPELRQVIAATVASDPTKYNEAFLGKPNADYCAWILGSENWGGVIELSILADYYRREIAAYDIQTTFCDLYGQDGNYSERVMLIYDGLHYDALAMSPSEGAPEEFDQTIFAVRADRTIGLPADLALNLVEEQQRKRPANFTWHCGVCQIGLIGQKETVEHAQATGHVNFKEYI